MTTNIKSIFYYFNVKHLKSDAFGFNFNLYTKFRIKLQLSGVAAFLGTTGFFNFEFKMILIECVLPVNKNQQSIFYSIETLNLILKFFP